MKFDRYEYRIVFSGTHGATSQHIDSERWSKCCDVAEERGLSARLERRFVTDREILPSLCDATGWLILKDVVISPWEILAEADYGGLQ